MVDDPSKRRRIWCPLVERRSLMAGRPLGGMYMRVRASAVD